MKFAIITIDDSRAEYKKVIRERVTGIEEVFVPGINGHTADIEAELAARGIPSWSNLTPGELGVWLSVYDHWKWAAENDEELLVFEDDAVPTEEFNEKFSRMVRELPSDYDMLVLWVPPNQLIDYRHVMFKARDRDVRILGTYPTDEFSDFEIRGNEYVCRAYNGYGNVAMLYSPAGAAKFVAIAQKEGLHTPADCFQYILSHNKDVKGFGPYPWHANLVEYDWAPSLRVG